MFKRKSILLAITLIISGALYADKPATSAGKFGASILQTIHKHPYISSFTLATLLFAKKRNHGTHLLITWIAGGFLAETVTKALMQNFDIDPISN